MVSVDLDQPDSIAELGNICSAVLDRHCGVLPAMDPDPIGARPVNIPARAMAFIVYPDANAQACQ